MKTIILTIAIAFSVFNAFAQNPVSQIDQLDLDLVNQNGIIFVGTIGEAVHHVDVQDVAVISSYFPASFFDTTGTSGLRQILPIEGLQAWPNPVQSTVILSIDSPYHTDFRVEVYNEAGQYLSDNEWTSGEQVCELPLYALAPGQYYLMVSEPSTGRISHLKVVKQ